MSEARPITLLIAALGGEGGGVLSGWIVAALESRGLIAQSTSIPGVAQRTGATTYYIETYPVPLAELGDRRPTLSLYPSAGDIDVMVASELIEAGRAVQAGYVTPDRTTLVASTHRVFAIGERADMADGRFDSERVLEAAAKRSRTAHLADFAGLARDNGTTLNAVLLGVIAGAGVLPVASEAFEDAIRASGIAVEPNLRGFALGLAHGGESGTAESDGKRWRADPAGAVEDRARAEFPEPVHDIGVEAVRRLVEFQGPSYASLYLDRLARLRAVCDDATLLREVARQLALWMAYHDVIRVAQLKAAPERHARVLDEIRAGGDDPVTVIEFFKPGVDELCAVLPPVLARPVLRLADGRAWRDRAYLGLHVKSTTINGYLRIWLLSKLRFWRPLSYGYRTTQTTIDAWLGLVERAASVGPDLALEVAACAELIKGYGDTHRRGTANFARIRDGVIEPALAGEFPPDRAVDAVANARAAALADPTGGRLDQTIAAIASAGLPRAAE